MTERANLYDIQAARKSVNLSINSDLIARAKALKINLSRVLEDSLVQIIREKEKENWIRENAQGIEEYNARVEKDGVFSDGQRKF